MLHDLDGIGPAGRLGVRVLAVVGTLGLGMIFLPLAELGAGALLVPDALLPADAIVVLAGGSSGRGHLSHASMRRTLHGIALYRQRYAPRIILSGGLRGRDRQSPSEAALMASLALSVGVPRQAIVIEHRSSRTSESARNVAAMLPALGANRVLLVTSRTHMRRACLSFRRAGVTTYPANVPALLAESLPGGRLVLAQALVHEYAGLLYYWWRGWV